MPETPIGPGTEVTLLFTLKLDTGEVVDSTGETPATFKVADGNLLPGFEQAMFGLRAGESAVIPIEAEQGFGLHKEENLQKMKKQTFSPDLELEEGLVVSFANERKEELPGVISRVEEDLVEVDFNHPLAGRDLVFEVSIISVTQVSAEIIRM